MEVGQEWNSFNGVNSINEEANFMAQLFQDSLTSSCYSGMSNGDDNVSVFLTDLSQGSSNYSGSGLNATATGCSNSNSNSNSSSTTSTVAYPFQGTYCLSDAYEFFPVEYYPSANKNFVHYFPCNNSMENVEMGYGEDHQPTLSNTQLQLKQEYDHISEIEPGSEDVKCNDSVENGGRKRSRIIEKGKRNIRTKKNQKTSSDDEDNNVSETHHHPTQCIPLIENNVPEIHRQNSGSSEEDYNGVAACSSLSSKGAATINSNGKTRASRGAATDPQSIYARKRRERINERLRILQNLVPNGTKVDISTMLEEAVQYVKFLQLQIKLLSSDDLWMYAPLAYNGMDIGLDSKIRALL